MIFILLRGKSWLSSPGKIYSRLSSAIAVVFFLLLFSPQRVWFCVPTSRYNEQHPLILPLQTVKIVLPSSISNCPWLFYVRQPKHMGLTSFFVHTGLSLIDQKENSTTLCRDGTRDNLSPCWFFHRKQWLYAACNGTEDEIHFLDKCIKCKQIKLQLLNGSRVKISMYKYYET